MEAFFFLDLFSCSLFFAVLSLIVDGVVTVVLIDFPPPPLYLPDDLNCTHQHCVLAGETARFSSTHRVAEVRSQQAERRVLNLSIEHADSRLWFQGGLLRVLA